jgi:predicted nucleotidyltransferase
MISNILTNKSVLKVLILYSYAMGAGYNWSDLKQYTKLHIASLKNALELLEFHKIIVKRNRIYKLNLENEKTQDLMKLINNDKLRLNLPSFELYLRLNSFIEEIQINKNRGKVKEIYLFGSHAKKKAGINSDIDIAIISDDLNLNFTKETIKLEESLGVEFQVIVLQKLSNDNLSDEIKKHGVKLI